MSDTPYTIGQRLESLAEEIEPHAPSSAARLHELSSAVNGGHSADIWASTDVFQLVDPEVIAEQVRTQGNKDDWIRMLELLRNAIVFAPIAVTWLGIWHALESYSEVVREQPDMAEFSFLFLWQLGFGGRSLTLSTIALIDGLLLAMVFVFTLIVLWHNNQKDIEAHQVRDELASVLTDASLLLSKHRNQQMTSSTRLFEQAAQDMLSELRQERQRLQDMRRQREQEASDTALLVQDMKAGMQHMQTVMQSLQQVPQQLEKNFLGLAQSLQHLSTQQKDQQKEFAQSIVQASTQLKDLTEAHQQMGNDLQTMGANLQAMGTNLSLLIQNLSSQQQEFVNTTSHAATQFKHLTEAQKTIGVNLQTMQINMQTMSVDLRTTVDTLQSAASETGRAAAEIGSLLPALTQMQTQLLKLLRQEQELVSKRQEEAQESKDMQKTQEG
jgi:hypothetical protein